MKKMIIFAVGLTLLVSCKGRTTDTVEPTGDTVEVNIEPVGAAPSGNFQSDGADNPEASEPQQEEASEPQQ